jgi:hypothetical protein
MEFHFTSNAGYVDGVHLRGDVVDYDEADARNLAGGRSGHIADDCPGAACPSVKAGFATGEKVEKKQESANGSTGTGTNNPAGGTNAGAGSDGAPNGSNDPATHACADCGGKTFATEAALKAHVRAKHPQLASSAPSTGGALVPPAL